MTEIVNNVPEPVSKRLDVPIDSDLMRSVKIVAAAMELSLKDFVALCLNEKIDKINAATLLKQRVEAVRYPHPFLNNDPQTKPSCFR